MSLVGQRLGEFEVIEILGQGGMGAVYMARQTSLRRIVALKTVQAVLAGDAEYIARFQQEAVAAAGLNHPNLVQVYAAGESEGLPWFAMEYIEGESAKVRLNRKGRLAPLEAVAIAIHVAQALDYGWRKAALIHRDIKPDNIFLSSDGEVKLGDLGLAKSVGQAQSITTTGDSMGTPHYMSPEQAEAMKDVDLRADIYSLGCTLFHILAGEPPYVGNTSFAVMTKHVSSPVPDIRDLWPECPEELAAAVRKMMQKQPKDRQQNYEAVVADLRRAHEVLSGAIGPAKNGAPPPPVVGMNPKPVAGAAKKAPTAALVYGAVAAVCVVACVAVLAYYFIAPRKNQDASSGVSLTPGGTRSGVSPTSPSSQPATPPNTHPLAVATTLPPETAPVTTTPAPAPPRPALATPEPSTPPPSTPAPPPTPPPPTEVEKWFVQVDGPQEEVFQKQVLKPYEAGLADLRARYSASLEASIAKASAAGQLLDAIAWRTERLTFEKAQNVPAADDTGLPSGILAVRAAFRQQLARLEHDRLTQAKTLFAPYDASLAKNQVLLTQHQRLDDALLLKTKRDEIAAAWIGAATPQPIPAPSPQPESTPKEATPQAITPKPFLAATATKATSTAGKVSHSATITFSGIPPYPTPVDSFGTMFPGVTLSSDNEWVADMVDNRAYTSIQGRSICPRSGSRGALTVTFASVVKNVAMDLGSGRKDYPVTAEIKGYRNEELIFTSSFTTQPGPKGGEEIHAETTGVVDRIVISKVDGSPSLVLDNFSYVSAGNEASQTPSPFKPR